MVLLRFPSFNSAPLSPFSFQSHNHLLDISASFFSLPTPAPPFSPGLVIAATKPRTPLLHPLSSFSEFSVATVGDPTDESGTEAEVIPTRLCAQNVPWTYTTDDLRALFGKYGTVVDVEISMHDKTRNRGLAFITMGSVEEALAALTNLESLEVDGRALKVSYARLRKKKPAVRKYHLFVGNLPFEADDEDLKEFFDSEIVKVVSAEVMYYDNPRRSAGYGYVSYDSRLKAAAARTAFHGKVFMGRPIRVEPSTKPKKKQSQPSAKTDDALAQLNPEVDQSSDVDITESEDALPEFYYKILSAKTRYHA